MVSIVIYVESKLHIIILEITCPALPIIVNGTIVYSFLGSTEGLKYGTIATYQCNSGYNITSGDRVRTCTGDGSTPSGQWSGTAPQCSRMFYYCIIISHDNVHIYTAVDCNTPPSITNGSPETPTTTTFKGTVTYSCNDGYALIGNATSTCQADATWSRPPECRGVYLHIHSLFAFTSLAVVLCCLLERICPVGTYHEELSTGESVCVPCPRNTFSIVENSVECTCFRGYYRTKLEGPNFPCSCKNCKACMHVCKRVFSS